MSETILHIAEMEGAIDNHAKLTCITEPGDVPASEGAKKEVRYADINRPVDLSEVASVKKAAEEAGIWRFVEAAKHGGFNI